MVGGHIFRYRLPVKLSSRVLLTYLLSFLSIKMPRSKKGRLAGGARKEINESRATEAVAIAFMSDAERTRKAAVLDFVFGRVTKMTGANHVRVAIACKRGTREIAARIPNIFARRGATPITTRTIVTIHTGEDFEPDKPSETTAMEHYDITSILSDRQAADLKRAGLIPEWMTTSDVEDSKAGKADMVGFEWDYGDAKETSGDEGEGAGFSRKGARAAAVGADDDEIDVDNI